MNLQEQIYRAPYNHLIKKLNICNIPLLESEEYTTFDEFFDVWLI